MEAAIEEAIATNQWVNVMPLLPPCMTPADATAILQVPPQP